MYQSSMMDVKDRLEADIEEMEYLTDTLRSALKYNEKEESTCRSIRLQSVIDDFELVKRSLKEQIKY
tara:strand:+ start:559 stop:759 length:201 start_codon:yes stop_codon:yes gene_type:complete